MPCLFRKGAGKQIELIPTRSLEDDVRRGEMDAQLVEWNNL